MTLTIEQRSDIFRRTWHGETGQLNVTFSDIRDFKDDFGVPWVAIDISIGGEWQDLITAKTDEELHDRMSGWLKGYRVAWSFARKVTA